MWRVVEILWGVGVGVYVTKGGGVTMSIYSCLLGGCPSVPVLMMGGHASGNASDFRESF